MDDGAGPVATTPESALSASVLVLNRNYVAIRVISGRRAFSLLWKGFAEAIDAWDGEFGTFDFSSWVEHSIARRAAPQEHDQFVRTPRIDILVPRVVRLASYDKVPRREVKFSRRNILARDEHHCQYCGRRFPTSLLSIDHVVPKSRGGRSTWTNVVAACTACNTRKGGRMPAEAAMRLRREPVPPRRNPVLVDKVRNDRYQVWRHFLGESEMAIET